LTQLIHYIASPLEQFELTVYYFYICSYEQLMFVSLFFLVFIFNSSTAVLNVSNKYFYDDIHLVWERFYRTALPGVSSSYKILFLLVVNAILVYNIIGLFPYIMTLSSQFSITFTISFIVMVYIWLSSFILFKVFFF